VLLSLTLYISPLVAFFDTIWILAKTSYMGHICEVVRVYIMTHAPKRNCTTVIGTFIGQRETKSKYIVDLASYMLHLCNR
jgi:hypothetical protein